MHHDISRSPDGGIGTLFKINFDNIVGMDAIRFSALDHKEADSRIQLVVVKNTRKEMAATMAPTPR